MKAWRFEMRKNFMKLDVAMSIALDLARENILPDKLAGREKDLKAEQMRQNLACDVVEDFLVNVVAEGRVKK